MLLQNFSRPMMLDKSYLRLFHQILGRLLILCCQIPLLLLACVAMLWPLPEKSFIGKKKSRQLFSFMMPLWLGKVPFRVRYVINKTVFDRLAARGRKFYLLKIISGILESLYGEKSS